MSSRTQYESKSRLGQFGKWFGIVGAVLGGLPIAFIAKTVIVGMNVQPGDTGGAMSIGMAYIVLIPMVSIPMVVFCLFGIVLSGLSLRQRETRDAQLGLVLAMFTPVIVAGCYLAGYALSS